MCKVYCTFNKKRADEFEKVMNNDVSCTLPNLDFGL